jgi:hypothetical protein
MRAIPGSVAVCVPALALALVCVKSARADDDPSHHLGDHPAIVVQRLHKSAGYDYASKFYPHPAWLRLYAEPPRDGAEMPPPAGGQMLAHPRAERDSSAPIGRDAPAQGSRRDR